MNKSVRKEFKKKLRVELFKAVESLENSILKSEVKVSEKRAVFDLDNTLLVGDIGDALFARIKDAEKKDSIKIDRTGINFSWSEYKSLIASGNSEKAYRDVVKSMSGIPVKTIQAFTRELIFNDFMYIEIDGERVPIPFVNPDMEIFVSFLKALNYEIFVISASNAISVKLICEEFFDIPEENAYGIESQKRKSDEELMVFTNELIDPVPVGEGKTKLYLKEKGDILPLIVAGDSQWDIPLLKTVHDNGIPIWIGDDDSQAEEVKSKLKNKGKNFLFVKRSLNGHTP